MPTSDAITRAIVRDAVIDTLLAFGIDVSDPEGVVRFQRDMHYLRAKRLEEEATKNKAVQKGVDLLMTGVAAALILGAAQFFGLTR